MPIYLNTNVLEMRGLVNFSRASERISSILQRLETGYRINAAKDDPTGLVTRESMRADMKGIQVAQKNTDRASTILTAAESAMEKIAGMLNGNPSDARDVGILGLIYDDSVNAALKRDQIINVLDSIDYITRTTVYDGKQIINGALDYNVTALQLNGGNVGTTVSDVRVARAEVSSGATSLDLGLTVTAIGRKGGVELDNTTAIVIGKDDGLGTAGSVTLTFDIAGRTINIVQENDDTANTVNFDFAAAATELNRQLGGTNVVASYSNSTKKFTVQSTEYSPASSVGIISAVAGSGALGGSAAVKFKDLTDPLAIAVDTVGTQLDSTGVAWNLTPDEGIAVIDKTGKVSVSSNLASYTFRVDDTIADGDTISFKVAGGGATFQIGKDVTSNNQLKIGIQSVGSSSLGGASGTLDLLRSLDYSKEADKATAYSIINEAITDLAATRGRIGTVQKYTLDVNRANLDDQLTVLTAAEAAISETDVVVETSNLARQELIADYALNSILFSRAFAQYSATSLF